MYSSRLTVSRSSKDSNVPRSSSSSREYLGLDSGMQLIRPGGKNWSPDSKNLVLMSPQSEFAHSTSLRALVHHIRARFQSERVGAARTGEGSSILTVPRTYKSDSATVSNQGDIG